MVLHTYHEILFTTRKEIRDRRDNEILGAYMKLRTLTDQHYAPRKQEIVKPTIKWRVPEQTTSKSNTFTFDATKQQAQSQFNEPGVFLCLGREHTHWKHQRISSHPRTVMTKRYHASRVRRSTHDQGKQIRMYVIRAQELRIEANKHGQIRIANWDRRQQQKLERSIKVLIASEDLKKRLLVKSKTKK